MAEEDLSNRGSATTYVAVGIVGNDKKAALKEAKKIAAERLGDKTPELVSEDVVEVGRDLVPTEVKDPESGEVKTVNKEVGRFELRTTWRFTWDRVEASAPADPSPDQTEQPDSAPPAEGSSS